MAVDTDEVWERFTLDGNEAITGIEESLLKLEAARGNRDELNRLYRGLHTLKGNSGFMGLGNLERLAHACEDLIGLFRDQGFPFDDESVELILGAVDRLRTLVEQVARTRKDADLSAIAEPLAAIEHKAHVVQGKAPPPPPAPPPVEVGPAPADPDQIDPATDVGYLEIFLSMARENIKELSPLLAMLLADRNDELIGKLVGHIDDFALASDRMGFLPLVDALEQLKRDVQTVGRPEHLAQLELELHANLVAIETQYRSLTTEPQNFGLVELYERACANAAFADLATLREELDSGKMNLVNTKAVFARLIAACRYYGFKKGVEVAFELEDRLARTLECGTSPEEALTANAGAFVEGLGRAIFAANAGEESPDVQVAEAANDPMKFAPAVEKLPFTAHLRPGLTRTALAALTHFSEPGHCILELHAALEEVPELQAPFAEWMSAHHASLVCSAVVDRPALPPLYVFLIGLEQSGTAALEALTGIDGGRHAIGAWILAPNASVPLPEDFRIAPVTATPAPAPTAPAPAPKPSAPPPAPTASAPPPRPSAGFSELPSEGEPPEGDSPAVNRTEFLRIDARKVSLIMDIAAEIGLASGAVTHHPDVVGRGLEGFTAAAHKLDVLIRELQNEVSAMRLVPVDGVFQRMKRVVRDTARRTKKQVELVLVGEDTEIDKLMVDALHDPLVHMLRNAIDHGLETPDDRRAAGKAETGRIVLEASHQGGEVLVEISDDGKGLNRDRIRSRAIERGLIEPNAELSDQQTCELIFLPGFSTKETIDELSGRGVGMDVVKTSIEALRGRVQVTSTEGRGTRVRLSVPLTLAFVEAMIVRERERLFAVPVEKVFEVFQVEKKQITRNEGDGDTLVRVRERLVPVLWLHRFYGEELGNVEKLDGRILVVVQTSRGELAIPVDALLGNQQVMLKPLVGPLAKVRAAAGCGMLRTGEVALALDCERLNA
jgi:two-component system chemotaxis sensor kinase CheA